MLLFMCKYTLILLLSKEKTRNYKNSFNFHQHCHQFHQVLIWTLNIQFKESRLIGGLAIAFQQI